METLVENELSNVAGGYEDSMFWGGLAGGLYGAVALSEFGPAGLFVGFVGGFCYGAADGAVTYYVHSNVDRYIGIH